MSTRAVLVAAVITGLILGIVGTRPDDSASPRRNDPIVEAGD
ncbi:MULTISPECIES: hypothetical protein [unclassified Streptomyces]|nr:MULTISPECIES: hypothetical protein [unclassified Streptomyces]